MLATWKLLVGLVLIPTLYGLYSLLAFIFLVRTEWNWKMKLFIPLTIWNTLPFISYASMRFAENGLEVYRYGIDSIYALFDIALSLTFIFTYTDLFAHYMYAWSIETVQKDYAKTANGYQQTLLTLSMNMHPRSLMTLIVSNFII